MPSSCAAWTSDPDWRSIFLIHRASGAGCPMTRTLDVDRTNFLAGLAATILASIASVGLYAEEIGHQQFHDSHYRHWTQPGTNVSCCSDQDCAPVTAEFRQGQWFALRQGEWLTPTDGMGSGSWLPLRQLEWIAVPEEKILRAPNPTVEGGHLCYANGVVICFVPPNTGG